MHLIPHMVSTLIYRSHHEPVVKCLVSGGRKIRTSPLQSAAFIHPTRQPHLQEDRGRGGAHSNLESRGVLFTRDLSSRLAPTSNPLHCRGMYASCGTLAKNDLSNDNATLTHNDFQRSLKMKTSGVVQNLIGFACAFECQRGYRVGGRSFSVEETVCLCVARVTRLRRR